MPKQSTAFKLQKIASDIKALGNVNQTRLTVLKKWFETPRRLASFGIFIAIQGSRHPDNTTGEAAALFHDAHEILTDVDVFEPEIPHDTATMLFGRLQAFQNEYKDMRWASVRILRNMNLFFVESGLGLYLRPHASPAEGYDVAARYCEHYDPRFGNDLNGPSVDKIEEIVRFVVAMEAHEEGTAHR